MTREVHILHSHMRSCAVVMQSAIYMDLYSKYISSTQTFCCCVLWLVGYSLIPHWKWYWKCMCMPGVCRYEVREPQLLKLPYHNVAQTFICAWVNKWLRKPVGNDVAGGATYGHFQVWCHSPGFNGTLQWICVCLPDPCMINHLEIALNGC